MVRGATLLAIVALIIGVVLTRRSGDEPPKPPKGIIPPELKPPVVDVDNSTFVVEAGQPPSGISLTMDVPPELTVARDYDQRTAISVRNTGKGIARLRVRAFPPEDLPSGFVGQGSEEWHELSLVDLNPGETWSFPFVIHAAAAEQDRYKIPVQVLVPVPNTPKWVVAAEGALQVRVPNVPLKLEISWKSPVTPQDRARLVHTLVIKNMGATIPDLSLSLRAPGESGPGSQAGKLWLNPTIERMVLGKGVAQEIRVWPRLEPGFRAVQGTLYISGNGITQTEPFSISMPEGLGVFLALSRSDEVVSNTGTRCTNRRETSYSFQPADGTPSTNDPPPVLPPKPPTPPPPTPEPEPLILGTGAGAGIELPPEEDDEEVKKGDTSPVNSHSNKGKDGNGEATEPAGRKRKVIINEPLGETPIRRPGDCQVEEESAEADIISADDQVLGDPLLATRLITSFRDSKGVGILVARHRNGKSRLDYYIPADQGSGPPKLHQPLVRWEYGVSGPVLGRAGDGRMIAAFERASEAGGMILEVRDLEGGRRFLLGEPKGRVSHANIVVHEGKTSIVYLDRGAIKRASIKADFTPEAPEILEALPSGAIRALYRARAGKAGKVALLFEPGEGQVTFRNDDEIRQLEGMSGDFLLLPDGASLIVVQDSKGTIRAWTGPAAQATVIAEGSPHTGPPALVSLQGGGARVTYHEAAGPSESPRPREGSFARDFKDGSWTAEARLYQDEAPVTDAVVVLQFSLPWERAHYKEMNTDIFLNGKKIGSLSKRVPSGRYIFPVPPRLLNYRDAGGGPAPGNQVSLKIQGIGPGNFHVTDLCEIYTRHNLIEEYLVARDSSEASRLAVMSRPEIRHGTPDLLLASNLWNMPRKVKAGDQLTPSIILINLGSKEVPAGTVVARALEREIGSAKYPALSPGKSVVVPVQMGVPTEWKEGTPLDIRVSAPVAGDPRPDTNELHYYLLRDLDLSIAGSGKPAGVELGKLTGVTNVDDPTKPYEADLATVGPWFRLRVPDKGRLQLEVTNVVGDPNPETAFFNSEGQPVTPRGSNLRVSTEFLFLRLRLPSGLERVEGAKLKIWWE